MNDKPNLKCISLIGELADWGKHIYMVDLGVTICGCFTVDYDKDRFKDMPDGVTSEYKIEKKFKITCEKCIEVMNIIIKGNEAIKKARININ